MTEFSQWLYALVPLGAAMFASTWWLTVRGVFRPGGKPQRFLYFTSLFIMLTPGGIQWYFSQSIILLIALLLCACGGFHWLKSRLGN